MTGRAGGARTRLAILCALALAAACLPPSWGASALIHPQRRPLPPPPALEHRELEVESEGATLKGWLFRAEEPVIPRVAVVFLHGLGDNRASGTWIAEKLVPLGFDVVAFDSRAHGESGGAACTYGYREKRDLSRILDVVGAGRVILVGASLGAAIALQAAPDDPRVVAVAAAGSFSDLATYTRERVAMLASDVQVRDALALAEEEARFEVAKVSPVEAARRIRVPVLVLHGEDDHRTSVEHSRSIHAALAGPKRWRVVTGASHHDVLSRAWPEISHWIDVVAETSVR